MGFWLINGSESRFLVCLQFGLFFVKEHFLAVLFTKRDKRRMLGARKRSRKKLRGSTNSKNEFSENFVLDGKKVPGMAPREIDDYRDLEMFLKVELEAKEIENRVKNRPVKIWKNEPDSEVFGVIGAAVRRRRAEGVLEKELKVIPETTKVRNQLFQWGENQKKTTRKKTTGKLITGRVAGSRQSTAKKQGRGPQMAEDVDFGDLRVEGFTPSQRTQNTIEAIRAKYNVTQNEVSCQKILENCEKIEK